MRSLCFYCDWCPFCFPENMLFVILTFSKSAKLIELVSKGQLSHTLRLFMKLLIYETTNITHTHRSLKSTCSVTCKVSINPNSVYVFFGVPRWPLILTTHLSINLTQIHMKFSDSKKPHKSRSGLTLPIALLPSQEIWISTFFYLAVLTGIGRDCGARKSSLWQIMEI